MMRLFTVVVCAIAVPLSAYPASENLIWGDLQPGPRPVGFRVHVEQDASRAERPLTTLEGAPQPGSILRSLEISVWYPARSAPASKRMRFGDYMTFADDILDARADDRRGMADPETRRRNAVHAFATFGIFGGTPESAWKPILDSSMHAVRDAPPAAGRFPVILNAPGATGTAVFSALSCEYLASHGYVVLSVPSRGLDALNDRLSGGAFYESQARDLEYLLAYASRLSFADTSRIGVFAWSRGGAAAILLQMRDARVAGVVGWDAGAIETRRESDRLRESPFYDPDRVTSPVLHIRAGNPGTQPALFESLRYAPRYLINVDGIHHLDFSVAAMIHTALGLRNQYINSAPDRIRAAHASINVVTRRFFDSFVKGMGEFSAVDLQPAGMFTFSKTEAMARPPSAALLLERIFSTNGIGSARSHIERARQSWPGWRPFPEPVLNWIGSRMSELGRKEEAVQVQLLNVDLYPESAGAWAGLGSTQEAFGDKHAARQSFIKALELDPKNENALAALQRLGKTE